jgi:branched-subunit amino acid aminotransferase/4-amino-4-deoxychorismate lyase
MAGERLVWTGRGWDTLLECESDPPAVVDSWLVRDGRMRAPQRHADRFSTACASVLAVPFGRAEEFFWAAIDRIPVSGEWFPRVELVVTGAGARFQLRIRPSPARQDTIRLWLSTSADQRSRPTVKGPDLEHLAGLRHCATERGAEEAVILSAAGAVLEGATTSILWWREDVLCAPPQTGSVLPGVTRAVITALAARDGIDTRWETCRPEQLDGLEVWAVNALHGIRPVTGWVGVSVHPGPATRAVAWRARLAGETVSLSHQRVRS